MSTEGERNPDLERRLIIALQEGLPLVPAPYALIAEQLGVTEAVVLERVNDMLDRGAIRRIGAVPNHYAIGWTANGMTVWDVSDAAVDRLGEQVGALPFVSHCYRRPRAMPHWPYNLFAMVHGASREECTAKAAQIQTLLGADLRQHDILYSSRILKKTGLRLIP